MASNLNDQTSGLAKITGNSDYSNTNAPGTGPHADGGKDAVNPAGSPTTDLSSGVSASAKAGSLNYVSVGHDKTGDVNTESQVNTYGSGTYLTGDQPLAQPAPADLSKGKTTNGSERVNGTLGNDQPGQRF